MRNFTRVVLLLSIACITFAQEAYHPLGMKDRYDIRQEIGLNQLKSGTLKDFKLALQNDTWQYTLMDGGFFTIGLNNGKTGSSLEKNSQITYGHPYSMTSFAYATIDGKTILPEALLANDNDALNSSKDTLFYTVEISENVFATLLLHLDDKDQVKVAYTIENKDEKSHEVGAVLLLDPALGKWGDGALFINGSESNESVQSLSYNDSLVIYERSESPKGIGVSLKVGENQPDNISAGNWSDVYEGGVGFDEIYDLSLLFQWNPITLAAGEKMEYSFVINQLPTDYTHKEFIRWNLPRNLSIEKNSLFPMDITSNLEIVSDQKIEEFSYQIVGQPYVEEYEKSGIIPEVINENKLNELVNIEFLENYDSVIVPITLNLLQNGQIVDHITRKVLIPAAPYSDEGLKVEIDSIYTIGDDIFLNFNVKDQSTEQLLYKVFKNNTSLFYNDIRIKDFTLEKDKSGQVNEVDIVFILDVTGSMSGEINAVKSNIVEFTDSLTKNGVDYRLGMVTFLDVIENKYEFTNDNEAFKNLVGQQYAHGGGDYPENSLLGIFEGTSYQFRAEAKRIFIWITDASYHINNSYTSLTKEQVVEELLSKGIQTHCIGNPKEQLDYYDQITLNTGGNFYDINGNFRDILLDISRLGESPRFKIALSSDKIPDAGDLFKVEVHYAGKGGNDTIEYNKVNEAVLFKQKQVAINPMPIDGNSILTISEKGEYNVQYQLLNLKGQVIYAGKKTGVTGQSPVILSELMQQATTSKQTLLLKVDLLTIENMHLQTQVIKIIR